MIARVIGALVGHQSDDRDKAAVSDMLAYRWDSTVVPGEVESVLRGWEGATFHNHAGAVTRLRAKAVNDGLMNDLQGN